VSVPKDVELARSRSEIERLDRQLLALIERRARLVRKIWAHKRRMRTALRDRHRERELLKQWLDRTAGSMLLPSAIARLFAAVLRATRPAAQSTTRPVTEAHSETQEHAPPRRGSAQNSQL
jgi:chorismate mutase